MGYGGDYDRDGYTSMTVKLALIIAGLGFQTLSFWGDNYLLLLAGMTCLWFYLVVEVLE